MRWSTLENKNDQKIGEVSDNEQREIEYDDYSSPPETFLPQSRRKDCTYRVYHETQRTRTQALRYVPELFTDFGALSAVQISNATNPPVSYAEIEDHDDREV